MKDSKFLQEDSFKIGKNTYKIKFDFENLDEQIEGLICFLIDYINKRDEKND